MNVNFVDQCFQDVNRGNFQQVNLLQNLLTLFGILRAKIVVNVVFYSLWQEIAELKPIADSSWAAKQIVVESQLVGGENVKLSRLVVDTVYQSEEHIVIFSFLERLLCLVNEDNTLEAERLHKVYQALVRPLNDNNRQAQGIAEQFGGKRFAGSFQTIEDDTEVFASPDEDIRFPGLLYRLQHLITAQFVNLEVEVEPVRYPLEP